MIVLTKKIIAEDLEIFLTRKNIKNIYLKVCPPNGKINLSIPLTISDKEIYNFISKKKEWIRKNKVKIVKANENYKEWSIDEINKGRIYLEERVPIYLKKWEPIMKVKVNSWYSRLMKSRWGSCNINDKRICINIALSRKSEDVLEYIIVHEMIHLKERNHNKCFYSYMTTYLPNWKELKKKLSKG